MQDLRTLGAMGAAAAGGQAIRRARARTLCSESAIALISLAPALMALRSGDLAAYHGVEHKAIAGYEEDEDAAELMGVPTFKFKLLAFAIGAMIGGLAGVVWSGKVIFIAPTNFPFQNLYFKDDGNPISGVDLQ